MKNNIALSLFLLPSIMFGSQAEVQKVEAMPLVQLSVLSPEVIMAPRDLGEIKVLHANKAFAVLHEGLLKTVEGHNVSKELRGITTEGLKELFSETDCYIRVQKKSDGQYALEAQYRLNGGGVLGAKIGSWIGKVTVYALGYGTISLISAATGPLAKGTFMTLTKFCAGPIESASNIAAIGCGIYLSVQTGPV